MPKANHTVATATRALPLVDVRAMGPLARQDLLWAFVFLLPTAVGFVSFVLGPLVTSFGISLLSWDLLTSPRFAGLTNYASLLTDQRLWEVVLNTLFFVIADVVLSILLGLSIALLLNQITNPVTSYLARAAFFLPVILSVSAAAAIWIFFLQRDLGAVNYYLGLLGVSKIPWLGSADWALKAVILMDVWKNLGFYVMVFLAGLHNIPAQFREAARMDGANELQVFSYVTLPMLTPTLFFALVIALINGFQVFTQPYILTQGGPGDASRTLVMYIYEQGFRFFQMGYASAIAVVLFVILASLTILQFRLGRQWVFYQ